VSKTVGVLVLLLALASAGCGYHTAGHAAKLPPDLKTIAIPTFVNHTHTYRVEQVLTTAVVREFLSRTHYRIANEASDSADATLRGDVLTTEFAPLTYDSSTGRASSALITVTMRVKLVDRQGKVLYQNENYVFREQYQVSREISSFFEEETPALDRLSGDFARTLVSNVLEAY
jgi:outer membrane lipopolysaccharide assembly protein LptE/RlpB